ncbi:hypothetical protein V6667_06010 [Neisseria leonii]|uniref:Uncharacterized protein n=1 Tax=Neisseria leonii TaxID=2995413 RepID=A0A9X4E928_9NEIS|nr:hypothetical protein [Neisseria sp. 51.81]MDD9327788.1 hypothetical protein [Neisseria sp. 51.81]
MSQKNNFKNSTFNSNTQIVEGNVYNIHTERKEAQATYEPEQIWRSPITLATLTWLSFIISVLSLFPIYKVVIELISILFAGNYEGIDKNNYRFLILIILLFLSFIIIQMLRHIAKKQIRYPLILNYAINGKGNRLTLEKIKVDVCPQCGGKMKYYNKPIEWRGDKVTKTTPALECLRNNEHWYKVDPAEDRI